MKGIIDFVSRNRPSHKFFNPRYCNCDLAFMENPASLYAIFFGKKRNSNYRLRLMQAFARKEVSNYWFCVLKSSRFSPKFFNPRRRHRDLALIPRPCVCNFTFGKERRKEIAVPVSISCKLLHERNYWFCISKSNQFFAQIFQLGIVIVIFYRESRVSIGNFLWKKKKKK